MLPSQYLAVPRAGSPCCPPAHPLPLPLAPQAACLWGWDLPRLLPDTAAVPRLQLLPTLVEDVDTALQHAERQLQQAALDVDSSSCASSTSGSGSIQSSGGAAASAARAVRWALKRCIRAAFELASCCGEAGGSSGSSSNASSSSRSSGSGSSSSCDATRVHSRDLFWCQHYAALRHPQLGPRLEAALERYVRLAEGPSPAADGGSAGQGAGEALGASHSRQGWQREASAAMQLASSLAAEIDGLFLEAMLREEPGWLTHHRGSLATAAQGVAAGNGGGKGGSRHSWWQRTRVRLWAASAAARGDSSLEGGMMGAPPPPVAAAVEGSVLTLDWRQPGAQRQAAAIIAATAAGHDSSSSSSSGGSLAPQPVLMKGAAAHWPAVQRWTLGRLAAAGLEGRARLAPSLQIPFTEPRLAAVVAEQQGEGRGAGSCTWRNMQWRAVEGAHVPPSLRRPTPLTPAQPPTPRQCAGPAALPSCLARMDAAEFAARMQRGNPCGLPPLVHPAGSEYLYFQAQLPLELLLDIDVAAPPFVLPGGSSGSSNSSTGGAGPPRLRQTQAARVWVGPQGAVSPTHYDTNHSVLAQIRGR